MHTVKNNKYKGFHADLPYDQENPQYQTFTTQKTIETLQIYQW